MVQRYNIFHVHSEFITLIIVKYREFIYFDFYELEYY